MNINEKTFNKEVLETDRLVVVNFYADWSGNFHLINPILKRLNKAYDEQIKFCWVDTEQNWKLTKSFGIQKLPSILFFNSGNLIEILSGIISQKQIIATLNKIRFIDGKNEICLERTSSAE